MTKKWKNWTVILAATVAFHYAWEMLQAPLFDVFAGLSFWEHAWPCFIAALGDVLIAATAYGIAGVVFRRPQWLFELRWQWPAVLCFAGGMLITIAYEHWALSSGRWGYTDAMPTIGGIGLSPILQWIAVPAVTLLLARWMARESLPG